MRFLRGLYPSLPRKKTTKEDLKQYTKRVVTENYIKSMKGKVLQLNSSKGPREFILNFLI